MSGLIQAPKPQLIQPILFGGKNARFQRVHGDIVASYQYVNDERAMALWPVRKKPEAAVYVVCDSAAWRYNPDYPRSDWWNPDGSLLCGPLYLMQQAAIAARVMGMDQTKSTVTRIAAIIAEGLEDLVRLPPAPPKVKPKPIGEASLLIGGKRVFTHEV